MISDSNILRLREVSVSYGRHPALRDVSVDIPCGSLTAILGPNGAGKSTLLKACLGWLPLSHGEIRIGDKHVAHALPRMAYLPQRQAIDWDFPITVREVVEQGRFFLLKPWQRLGERDRSVVDRALEELDLTELSHRQISQLSGGQQQRTFLARALAQGADIFLLDEPFAGLDLLAVEELSHILRAWEAEGRTVLAAVHSLELARKLFSRTVLLSGCLVAAGETEAVLSEANIDRAYRQGPATADNPLRLARTAEFPR